MGPKNCAKDTRMGRRHWYRLTPLKMRRIQKFFCNRETRSPQVLVLFRGRMLTAVIKLRRSQETKWNKYKWSTGKKYKDWPHHFLSIHLWRHYVHFTFQAVFACDQHGIHWKYLCPLSLLYEWHQRWCAGDIWWQSDIARRPTPVSQIWLPE